jgi:D-3-phosphoglycerate dehydrogenase
VLAGLHEALFLHGEHGQRARSWRSERGIQVREIRMTRSPASINTLVRVTVETEHRADRSVAGTLFADAAPRLVELFGISIEAELDGHMLYVVNRDQPGFHRFDRGRCWAILGINIGTFHLGRRSAGGEAILLLSVDQPIPAEAAAMVEGLANVTFAKPLYFD